MEHAAALSHVVAGKAVPECVTRPRRGSEVQLSAQCLHIAEHIPTSQQTAVRRTKQQIIRLQTVAGNPPEDRLPQFDAHRHDALLASLTVQGEQQVIEIAVTNPESKRLADSCPGIEQHQYQDVESSLCL